MSAVSSPDHSQLAHRIAAWYRHSARDLPWRAPDVTPWGVLVSEFMLQQTQVSRVLPRWEEWMRRWPDPASLAAESTAEVIQAWGRLGYPRRALWLQQCAQQIAANGGEVPHDLEQLQALPGIGPYTAAAVASFAFRKPVPVVDTNVRRVLVRVRDGKARADPSARDRTLLDGILPTDGEMARTVSLGFMELGALLCTATPNCRDCPLRGECAWRAAGYPPSEHVRRHQAKYAGSGREARGIVLARLRRGPTPISELLHLAETARMRTALDSLLTDGLAVSDGQTASLPGTRPPATRPAPGQRSPH